MKYIITLLLLISTATAADKERYFIVFFKSERHEGNLGITTSNGNYLNDYTTRKYLNDTVNIGEHANITNIIEVDSVELEDFRSIPYRIIITR